MGSPWDDPAASWLRALAESVHADPSGELRITPTRSGALIAVLPELVVKVHQPRLDDGLLAARVGLAASTDLAPWVLAPLRPDPVALPPEVALALGGPWRRASLWPRVHVLDPDQAELPWATAGRLLAGLHRSGVPQGAPVNGSAERLDRALTRLAGLDGPDTAAVRAAGMAVAEDLAHESPGLGALVHGDWHLGQLGRLGAVGQLGVEGQLGIEGWRLIDVDDLGTGPPALDLARPAGFWAAGLVPDAAWVAFLEAYRGAGGPGVPSAGDPWPALDPYARAAVVVAAARVLAEQDPGGSRGGPADTTGPALVAACRRMPPAVGSRRGTHGAHRGVVLGETTHVKESR